MSGMQLPDVISDYINSLSFRNNPKLRPNGSVIEYTEEMKDEYIRCSKDPIYFIENYCKVIHVDKGIVPFNLHDYQKRMIRSYHENRFVCTMSSRQMGKCCSINTKVKIKHKTTGKIVELTLGEFYEWGNFRKADIDEAMQILRERNKDNKQT